jgi:hypothetical protein
MSMPDFLVIAALIAVARWVIRSVREVSVELPPGGSEARKGPPAARPGPQRTSGTQRTPAPQRTSAPQRTTAAARRPPGAKSNAEWLPAWNIVLDLPEDAPRSEIQAAAKRRIAGALSSGDRAAIEQITRAAATGLKQRALRFAGEFKRGSRGR